MMISLIRGGGWGVKNSGKSTDVIVERSLTSYYTVCPTNFGHRNYLCLAQLYMVGVRQHCCDSAHLCSCKLCHQDHSRCGGIFLAFTLRLGPSRPKIPSSCLYYKLKCCNLYLVNLLKPNPISI